MAATTDSSIVRTSVPTVKAEIQFSAITNSAFSVSYPVGAPSGVAPRNVHLETITQATDGSIPGLVSWSADATNDELDLKIDVPSGGSLTGAVVVVHAEWVDQAKGGIS